MRPFVQIVCLALLILPVFVLQLAYSDDSGVSTNTMNNFILVTKGTTVKYTDSKAKQSIEERFERTAASLPSSGAESKEGSMYDLTDGRTLSPDTQMLVTNVITQGGEGAAESLASSMSVADMTETQGQLLTAVAKTVSGLHASGAPSAEQLEAAVTAWNNAVDGLGLVYLSNAPDSFRAVQFVLGNYTLQQDSKVTRAYPGKTLTNIQ